MFTLVPSVIHATMQLAQGRITRGQITVDVPVWPTAHMLNPLSIPAHPHWTVRRFRHSLQHRLQNMCQPHAFKLCAVRRPPEFADVVGGLWGRERRGGGGEMTVDEMTLEEYGVSGSEGQVVTLPVRFVTVSDYKRSFMIAYCAQDVYSDIYAAVCGYFAVERGDFMSTDGHRLIDNQSVIGDKAVLFLPHDHQLYHMRTCISSPTTTPEQQHIYTTARIETTVKQLTIAYKSAFVHQNINPRLIYTNCYCHRLAHTELPPDSDLLLHGDAYQGSQYVKVIDATVQLHVAVCRNSGVPQVLRRIGLRLDRKVRALYDRQGKQVTVDIYNHDRVYTKRPKQEAPSNTVTANRTVWSKRKMVIVVGLIFICAILIVLFWQ